ncbi:Uncharacterized protein FWK35_00029544, partial [Aphis craccivora]
MCNILQGSFNNHLQSHSIYEFFPSGRTGSKGAFDMGAYSISVFTLIANALNRSSMRLFTYVLTGRPLDQWSSTGGSRPIFGSPSVGREKCRPKNVGRKSKKVEDHCSRRTRISVA